MTARPSFLTLPGLLGLMLLAAPARAQGPCAWTPGADAPPARLESPSAVLDGRLVTFGGFLAGLKATKLVEAYDPVGDTWSSLADMPTAVTHAGLAVDDRQVWIAGGFLGNHPGPVVDHVWVYDVDLNSWSSGPPLPAPRGSGGLFRIDRELHYVGGVSVDRNTDQDDHWVLDLDNPVGWAAAPRLPIARNHFGTRTLGGRGYVVGGQFRHDSMPLDVDLVHVWDPLSGWSQLASLPHARSHFEPGITDHNGRIVVAGGRSIPLGLQTLPDVLAYDPGLDVWAPLAPLPQALIAPAVEVIGTELILSGGGPTENAPIDLTWRRPADEGWPSHVRLNSGGGSLALSQPWCPDLGAIGGKPFSNPSLGNVANTQDDELYETERTGSNSSPTQFSYSIPLAPGGYVVRLHFAEIFWGAPGGSPGGAGKRVFDVFLEGQLVLDDYDINAHVGPAAAVVHDFEVALGDGTLDLSFVASVDRPKLSGIEILQLSSSGSYCVAAPNSTGAGAHLSWAGSLSVGQNDLTLVASGCPPQSQGQLLQSQNQTQVPFAGGFVCVGPGMFRLVPAVQSDALGVVVRELDLTNPIPPAAQVLAGSTWNFQLWYRDAALSSSNLTDALSLTFLP